MITPGRTPTKRRGSYSSSSAKRVHLPSSKVSGSDHNDVASQHTNKARVNRSKSMWAKYQEGAENASGKVYIMRPLSMSQAVINQQSHFTHTDIDVADRLEFFTPRKFKDAEAVCFNGKTLAAGSYLTVATSANLETNINTYIENSGVNFSFRNLSQHNVKLEMYVCSGKGVIGTTSDPVADLKSAIDKLVGTIDTVSVNTAMFNPMFVKEWTDRWNVTQTVFKFEPGEKATKFIQGPKKYCMEGQKHCTIATTHGSANPVWLGPESPGNGIYVFFRYLNAMGKVIPTTGGDNNYNVIVSTGPTVYGKTQICHPANPVEVPGATPGGGVICEIRETIAMRAPEGSYNQAAKHVYHGFLNFGTGPYSYLEIDADDSGSKLTAPA